MLFLNTFGAFLLNRALCGWLGYIDILLRINVKRCEMSAPKPPPPITHPPFSLPPPPPLPTPLPYQQIFFYPHQPIQLPLAFPSSNQFYQPHHGLFPFGWSPLAEPIRQPFPLATRAGWGVSPTSPQAWATPLKGNQMKKKKCIAYIEKKKIYIVIHKIKYQYIYI